MKLLAIAASILLIQVNSIPTSPQLARATIEGTVVRTGSGDPIPGATVSLSDRGRLLPITDVTDDQGRFGLRNIDAGSYTVAFAANGYAKQELGARSFYGRGTLVTVAAGQAVKNINIAMTAAGNISGHVRDSAGAPSVGMPVQLLRGRYNAGGEKDFQVIESERTNDRGEYRFYWITPGRYYVSAGPSGRIRTALELNSGSPNRVEGDSMAHTYFPGVTNDNEATTIDVAPGAEVSGVDFSMVRQRFSRIRGRVIDSRTGNSPPAVVISPEYRRREDFVPDSSSTNYNASLGTFESVNVPSGSYFIKAYVVNAEPSVRALVPVEVSNQDVDGVVLSLGTGTPVAGRVTLDGAISAANFQVGLTFTASINGTPFFDQGGIAYVPIPRINADGTFRIESLFAGEYVLRANLPEGFYVKTARYNQEDILYKPFTFSGTEGGAFAIDISSRTVQISGVVTDDQSHPVAGIPVVLIPDRHRDRFELYKTATTDANGRYSVRGVSPEDYKLFALESVDVNEWFDPDFVKRIESRGKPLHILESSNPAIELKVISEN